MSIRTQDLAHLRWSLAVLVVALAATVAVVLVSLRMVGQAEATQRQLAMQESNIRGRIIRAREEEQDIRARIARYQQLRDRGIIGLEERLDWVEQIARIRNGRRLLDVQYELSPQRPIEDSVLPGGAVAGSHEIMASTMKLRMPLLHEDDLLGFLSDLNRAVHASLLVRDCTVERVATVAAERGLPAQLRADCTIDWITIREKRS